MQLHLKVVGYVMNIHKLYVALLTRRIKLRHRSKGQGMHFYTHTFTRPVHNTGM